MIRSLLSSASFWCRSSSFGSGATRGVILNCIQILSNFYGLFEMCPTYIVPQGLFWTVSNLHRISEICFEVYSAYTVFLRFVLKCVQPTRYFMAYFELYPTYTILLDLFWTVSNLHRISKACFELYPTYTVLQGLFWIVSNLHRISQACFELYPI